jgi:hypothetical protein
MKTLADLSKSELSLLLYFETCAVDHGGLVVAGLRMNDEDMAIASRWNTEGFVKFGRVCSRDLSQHGSNWCELSDLAFALAAEARKAKAIRSWTTRKWQTTTEFRSS